MIGFLQGPDGENSSSRLAVLSTLFVVLLFWGLCSWQAGAVQDIPNGVLMLLGIVVGGKVGNSVFVEKKDDPK